MLSPLQRGAYAVLAVVALAGVGTSLITGWVGGEGLAGFLRGLLLTPIDQLRFFTFLSNTMMLIAAAQLAITGRVPGSWHALRMAGVICLVITGVVFNLLLDEGGRQGWMVVNNVLVHIATPILAVAVWALAGPATSTGGRLARAAILPLLWLAMTLIRGALTGDWPYTILDPAVVGTRGAAMYLTAIFASFFLIGGVMIAVDNMRRRRRTAPGAGGDQDSVNASVSEPPTRPTLSKPASS